MCLPAPRQHAKGREEICRRKNTSRDMTQWMKVAVGNGLLSPKKKTAYRFGSLLVFSIEPLSAKENLTGGSPLVVACGRIPF